VKPLIVGANIATCRGRKASPAVDTHAGPVAIAVAAHAAESDGEPMIAGASTIEEEDWRTTECGDDGVHPAIVVDIAVDIAEGGAPRSQRSVHAGIDALETAVVVQSNQWNFLVAQ